MNDIDKILGQEIKGIQLLTWNDSQNPTAIELISFDFSDRKLILQLDSDNDTIKPEIVKDFTIVASEKEHKIIDSSMINEYGLADLIGKKIIWIWTLTNNQGYQDGMQIELNDHVSIQFMVEASFIWIKKLIDIKIPSR